MGKNFLYQKTIIHVGHASVQSKAKTPSTVPILSVIHECVVQILLIKYIRCSFFYFLCVGPLAASSLKLPSSIFLQKKGNWILWWIEWPIFRPRSRDRSRLSRKLSVARKLLDGFGWKLSVELLFNTLSAEDIKNTKIKIWKNRFLKSFSIRTWNNKKISLLSTDFEVFH